MNHAIMEPMAARIRSHIMIALLILGCGAGTVPAEVTGAASPDGPGAGSERDRVAILLRHRGEVAITIGGRVVETSDGMILPLGSILRTAGDGFALVRHRDGHDITVGANATVRIAASRFGASGVSLARGVAQSAGRSVAEQRTFRIATPVAVVGVRGTKFVAAASGAGSSIVSVEEGRVALGMGSGVASLEAGQSSTGNLESGYGRAAAGILTSERAEMWRTGEEQDLAARIPEVLARLDRLAADDLKDWDRLSAAVMRYAASTDRSDSAFLMEVTDIRDRMNARMLLAVDLREFAGITSPADAAIERARMQAQWDLLDRQARMWEAIIRGEAPDPADVAASSANAPAPAAMATPAAMERSSEVYTGQDVTQGIRIGMTRAEILERRPRATLQGMAGYEPPSGAPIVYVERNLSEGRDGEWATAMYYFLGDRLIQATWTAFGSVAPLRASLCEQFRGLGNPARNRLEPDFADAARPRGSTLEWRSGDLETILVSRRVQTMRGMTPAIELRMREAGHEDVLENPGQFFESPLAAERRAADFPEW